MRRTDVVVVGGGQAGLAMSRCLAARGIDHVVLERGRVAQRWRDRWDSLHLLTPRWQSRLPGFAYRGPDPDGYMSRGEVVGHLAAYAASFTAPVEEGVTVTAVARAGEGWYVDTDRGAHAARAVVIATGACDLPRVPALAAALAPEVHQVTAAAYRRPAQLPPGGVLVVGASASGVQLAAELRRSGRAVTLSVGSHQRLPRRYRGRDILAWLDAAGMLSEPVAHIRDVEVARRQPSMQLVGGPGAATLDLPVLRGLGVRLAGRLAAVDGRRVAFADDLDATVAAADARLERLLARVDAFASRAGLDATLPPPEPVRALGPGRGPATLDLRAEGIVAVVWATGYRRAYPWLHAPVLDAGGELRHEGGVTPAPGLYALGLPVMRRRNSTFLDGVGADARDLASHLAARLARRAAA